VMDRVRATVTGTALGQLEPFTRNGLGVLVNYYAGMPTRVSSLNHVLPTTSYAERHERLFELLDPDVVMRSWSRQLARLLHLGFVPATPASGRTGNMCQPQNAALDGGFFDVDSVEPICTLPGPAAVADALAASMRSFYYTVRSMLVERSYYHLGSADDVVEGWITSYVHTSMRRALAEEALPRVDLDPRVAQFFSADVELPDLLAALAAYHPTSSLQQARAEARDFLRAHPWMLPTTDGNRHPGQAEGATESSRTRIPQSNRERSEPVRCEATTPDTASASRIPAAHSREPDTTSTRYSHTREPGRSATPTGSENGCLDRSLMVRGR
jgi:hypothetical protein